MTVEKVEIELNSETPEENETVVEQPSAEIAEAIEEISSDAVAIAEIEAEKEITIEAIHAETEQARIDAEKEKVTWQEERILTLERGLAELRETVANMSIPPAPLETAVAEMTAETLEQLSETAPETSLILPSTADQTSEIQTELSVENEDGNQDQVTVTATRKYRRI